MEQMTILQREENFIEEVMVRLLLKRAELISKEEFDEYIETLFIEFPDSDLLLELVWGFPEYSYMGDGEWIYNNLDIWNKYFDDDKETREDIDFIVWKCFIEQSKHL